MDSTGNSPFLRAARTILLAAFFSLCLPSSLSTADQDSHVKNSRQSSMGKMYESIESVTVNQNYVYAGVGQRLVVLNVADPNAPNEVGGIEINAGAVTDVDVFEDKAYVAAGGAGLRIMGISQPINPKEIAFVNTPGYAEGVAVVGQYAYVADGGAGLRIIDISDHAQPREVGFAYVLGYAFDVEIVGNFAYVAGAGGGLRVVDISDPTHSAEVCGYNTPGYAYGLTVVGNTAYVADGWEGFRVIDVSDPTNPREIGFYKTPGWSFDVVVEGNTAYVADAFAGLRVIDISNPNNLVEIGSYEQHTDIHDLVVIDDVVYVADRKTGLRILQVSTSKQPTQRGFCKLGNFPKINNSERLFVELLEKTRNIHPKGKQNEIRMDQHNLKQNLTYNKYDFRRDSEDYQLDYIHRKRTLPQKNSEYHLEPVGQIGGPTQVVAIEGDHAYVGIGLRVEVLDISDLTNPQQIGSTQMLYGFITDITIADSYAYATIEKGLWIIDISDPTHPNEVGFLRMPGYAEGVIVVGNYAYVAAGGAGLRVVNVSNPAHPKEIGYTYTQGYAFDVKVVNSVAYVAGAGSGLRIVDISDPRHPEEIGGYDTPGYAQGIAVVKNMAYVADNWTGLWVIDVSVSTQPVEVGFYDTPGQAFDVSMEGSTAYVADAFKGLRVLDVSDPTHPTELGGYEVSEGHAGSVAVIGGAAYVADRIWGLRVVDVSDPSIPIQVGFYGPLGYADGVEVSSNFAYIVSTFGVRVVDISDPSYPIEVGAYDSQGYATSVAVEGNYVYVAGMYGGDEQGLYVIDVFDPTDPSLVGYCEKYVGAYRDMVVTGGIAYIVNEWGLEVISVADPYNPTLIAYVDLVELPSMTVGVEVTGEVAYVTEEWVGLKIVDVSDPTNPSLIGVYDSPGYALNVDVVENYAYVSDHGGLQIVDVSDPANPVGLGFYETPGTAIYVAVSENIAYMADGGGGVSVVDVSNPLSLALIDVYDTPGFSHEVKVIGNYIYLADGYGGLLILEWVSSHSSRVEHKPIPNALDLFQSWRNDSPQGQIEEYRKTSGLPTLYDRQKVELESISERAMIKPVFSFPPSHHTIYRPAHSPRSAGTYTVVSPADNGMGTLRWCLENAVNGDTITFDPVVFPPTNPVTIALTGQLTIYQENLTIDASNAGVILDGSAAPEGDDGIFITSDGNTIKGLQIMSFPGDGIVIKAGAQHNIIGGDKMRGDGPTGEGNCISGNSGRGIRIEGFATMNNTVIGNFIGTDVMGMTSLGNGSVGVIITEGAQHNVIGPDNLIAYNNGAGIRVEGPATNSNTITANSIYSNAGKGIVTIDGGNAQLAPPVLTKVDFTTIVGTAPANATIEIFSDNGGQGRVLEGSTVASNAGQFTFIKVEGLIGPCITATATDTDGNTSEFSAPASLYPEIHIVTSILDSGSGTLRQTLLETVPGDTIIFDPSVFPPSSPVTITLNSELPPLNQGYLTFDASNAGVILYGSNMQERSNGLVITSDCNLIKGVQILHFPENGVVISGGAKNNVIGGNRTKGNGPIGEGNLISGNGGAGIIIEGMGTIGNTIIGNFIGTDVSGATSIGNIESGIILNNGAQGNRIGGTAHGERNLISGNSRNGIFIRDLNTTNNIVIGNYIGTDVTGTRAIGNDCGVFIWNNASNNRVGGITSEERNVISGNEGGGISIMAKGTTGNIIIGNYVGTDVSGTTDLGNASTGIITEVGASGNIIKGNVSSGNGECGIQSCDWGSDYNIIIGNLVGTDATGTVALGNDWAGVCVGGGAAFNRVGGVEADEKNVISGNRDSGIGLYNGGGIGNIVMGNIIGLDASSTKDLGNVRGGVCLDTGARHVFIGGTTEEESNIISGNVGPGITLSGAGVEDNFIAGNYIGTDTSGTAAISNGSQGIIVYNASNNYIGPKNIIANNEGCGIEIIGSLAIGNTITRNSITSNNEAGIENREGGNIEFASPMINNVTSTLISGNSFPYCTMEIFSDPKDEGKVYEGTTTSDSIGAFIFNKPEGITGPNVTATTTDIDGNTSEFSAPVATGVRKDVDIIPEKYALFQNYPNPFNPETCITYWLPKRIHCELKIFNILGEVVRILVNEEESAGKKQVHWDGCDDSGNWVASGIYLYRLEANEFVAVQKLLLMR